MPLPKLQIIGTQKGGTTALHAALMMHPDVMPAIDPQTGEIVKEMHFFTRYCTKTLEWYESHFPEAPLGVDSVTYMESTPNYLCEWGSPARLVDTIEDARIVITLRDPVERALSQFNHYTQVPEISNRWDWVKPGESFQANIEHELENPTNDWYGLIKRGYYDEQFERLLYSFPRDQIHVMILERWSLSAEQSLAELLNFAGLKPYDLPFRLVHNRPYTVDPIDPDFNEMLREHFRPHNDRLAQLLEEPIPEWQ